MGRPKKPKIYVPGDEPGDGEDRYELVASGQAEKDLQAGLRMTTANKGTAKTKGPTSAADQSQQDTLAI